MSFPLHFLLCNVFVSVLLGVLLLSKRLLKNHITLKAQYQLWYLFVFSLLLPFIPYRIPAFEKLFLMIRQLCSQRESSFASALTRQMTGAAAAQDLGLTDFSTATASSNTVFHLVLWVGWCAGMAVAAGYLIYTVTNIYLLRKNARHITWQTEPELYHSFEICLQKLQIRREVQLYASCKLKSPVSYGLLRPKIIIPQDLDILLSEEDVHCIFLHELLHYKQKDALLNTLVCLLQVVYWFNPLLWLGFRQLQKDREIACDHAVISVMGQEKCLDYGNTLLKYAWHMQHRPVFSPLSTMGGSKDMLKQRIVEIASYKRASTLQKVKSLGVMLLALLVVCFSSPLLAAYASPDSSCHLKSEAWSALDAASYFEGEKGSFVLYDTAKDHYQIYNQTLSQQRRSPDSTFKIYSGLFALEEHVISPASSVQDWNGTKQLFDSWNQDQTLDTAMRNSVNWYFQNLDSQLGLAALYSYYHKISYGNCDLTGGLQQYWAESTLKISPMEQVMLLSDLLENKWNFKEKNIDAVKNSLFLSDTPMGRLYGKTGTGLVDGNNINGWFVGFIERDGTYCCFATNIHDSKHCTGSKASEITMNILSAILPAQDT